jgi:hypothetical protein
MRVLALGDVSQRDMFFPDDVEYVNEAPYEAALLGSVLQTIPRNKVQSALQTLYDDLPDGGRLVVTVPSLEWACRNVVTQPDISLAAYISMYGVEGEPHLSGFTLLWLRRCLEEVGFIVVEARSMGFHMQFKVGLLTNQEEATQHIAIGVKRQVDAEKQIDWMTTDEKSD